MWFITPHIHQSRLTTSSPTSNKTGNWPVTIALMAMSLLLLWVFRTQQFTGDSLWYANSALNGTDMFHPHHLLFTPVIRAFFLGLNSIGISVSIIEAGQLFNSSFAAFSIGLIHRILRVHVSAAIAVLVPVILLFCNGFWTYATQIEVYIPGIFFSLLFFWSLTRKKRTPATIAVSIVGFSMAVLFHQTNVLLAIPLFFLLGKNDWKNAVAISFTAGAVVLGAYVWVMISEGYSIGLNGFTAFSLKYAVSGQEGWGTFSNWMPMGWFELFASQTGNFIRQSYAHVVVYWLVFTFGIIWLLVFAFKCLKQNSNSQSLIRFCLIWIITNYIFFLWWLPKEGEFFIATLIPLVLLLAIQINGMIWKYSKAILPILLLVILGFNGFVFYQKHTQANNFGLRAQQIASISDESTVVVTDFFTEQYLEFFHQIKAESTDNLYRSIYEDDGLDMVKSVNQHQRLVISHQHLAPAFKSNGFSGITHKAKWNTGVQTLLKGACSIERATVLNEEFWLIERCEEPTITIDSIIANLEFVSP